MNLTFLGTSAGVPTSTRGLVALALERPGAELWLFDCGEGTLRRAVEGDLSLLRLRRVFVSHLHGDHVYGLPGVLTTRGALGGRGPLDVYGPAGLREWLEATWRATVRGLGFALRVHELRPGEVFADRGVTVTALPLRHRVPCFGFRVQEAPRRGRFDVDRARALGFEDGPLLGQLAAGSRVRAPDGRLVDGSALLGPDRPGRSLAVCTDTARCDAAVELSRGVQVLVHEATFGRAHAELAEPFGHSTAQEAAGVARAAGVGRLILTHFSPRYASSGVQGLVGEARSIFAETVAAQDGMRVEIPRP